MDGAARQNIKEGSPMPDDLLIKNGTVGDGTGSGPRRADGAVAGGKSLGSGKDTDCAKQGIGAPAEIAKIKRLLTEAVNAGALGFSTTKMNQHLGYGAKPLACRNADAAEFKAYCSVLKQTGKGAIEIALNKQVSVLSDDEYELLDLLVTESGRPVTYLALLYRDDMPDACRDSLRKAEPLLQRGVLPQVSPLPLTREVGMRNPFSFGSFPCWA